MVFVSMTEPDEPAFSMNYRSAVFEGRATLVTDEIEKMHALWLIGARWAGSQPIAKRRAYIEGDMARCDVWRIDVNVISGKTREMRR
jgi:nitroimidazol reductase NimA-like FMN-containing flavoprotein (pyridoxamine 5'-phosphate oxidase superfamily)